LSNSTYEANFRRAFIKRELPPVLEMMVWQYAHGRPRPMTVPVDDELDDEVAQAFEVVVIDKRTTPPKGLEDLLD